MRLLCHLAILYGYLPINQVYNLYPILVTQLFCLPIFVSFRSELCSRHGINKPTCYHQQQGRPKVLACTKLFSQVLQLNYSSSFFPVLFIVSWGNSLSCKRIFVIWSIFCVLSTAFMLWAASWQNQHNGCAPSELRSAWASAQSDQCLRFELSGKLRTQAFFMRTAKTQIRLGGCTGWSESSLGAHAVLLVLSWGGSYLFRGGGRRHFEIFNWVVAWSQYKKVFFFFFFYIGLLGPSRMFFFLQWIRLFFLQ